MYMKHSKKNQSNIEDIHSYEVNANVNNENVLITERVRKQIHHDMKTMILIPCFKLMKHKLKTQTIIMWFIHLTLGINFYAIDTDTSHFPYQRAFYNNDLLTLRNGYALLFISLIQIIIVIMFAFFFYYKRYSFKQITKTFLIIECSCNIIIVKYWKYLDTNIIIKCIHMLMQTIHVIIFIMIRIYSLETMTKQ
jgi:hypothetical protein